MALTELIFGQKGVIFSIGRELSPYATITLDASINEVYTQEATATEHPVEPEDGETSVISDHVHVKPLTLQIEGVVSNTPAIFAGALQAKLAGSFDPAGDAYKAFLEGLQGRMIVAIETSLGRPYKNMILESITVTRNAKSGNALYATLKAKQVRFVETSTVAAVKAPTAATKNVGRKPAAAAAATDTAQSQSLLSSLLSAIGG